MRWFGGRDPSADEDALDGDESEVPTRGPWDSDHMPDLDGRVDLGALRVPTRSGMAIRMEQERKTKRIVAVNLVLDGSGLQVQAFAAPRSSGLWEDLRGEIADMVAKQGGSVTEQGGPFGIELVARLPAQTPDGRKGYRPARFIGVDGPRWFLRGVITGRAAAEGEAARVIEEVLADIVVVRGSDARAPRDLLTLHMPGKPGEEVTQTSTARPVINLDAGPGPEITEVR
ncbi:MAG: DUF3710 domain-containing protein [Beutenbergiaceae bacterium]